MPSKGFFHSIFWSAGLHRIVSVAGIAAASCILPRQLSAQFYQTGSPPASVRWQQISTPSFRVVFPVPLSAEAFRLVQRLEFYRTATGQGFEVPARPFPVVLHGSSMLSNGFVAWTPNRMELVAVPPPDGYAEDWITQLAVHEYRHVVQLNELRQGFTRFMGLLTGQIAVGGVSAMLPPWLYEGDAVWNETRLSQTGRGRIPGFDMPLIACLVENGGPYSYSKILFGSYRDYVPDIYQYGYHLVQYGRHKFGTGFWPASFRYTARNAFMVWPFNVYLKQQTGFSKSKFYLAAMDSLRHMAMSRPQTGMRSYASQENPGRHDYVNYLNPQPLPGGAIMAFKTSLGETDRFVVIDTQGNESSLLTAGFSLAMRPDLSHSLLVWDERVFDPRWERRDYSEIRLFDLQTKKLRYLTRKTRYFNPVISPNNQYLAVVETDPGLNHAVCILSAASGDLVGRHPAPAGRVPQTPAWIGNEEVAVITVSGSGKYLDVLHLQSGIWETLFGPTPHNITEPEPWEDFILFRGSFTANENIYALHRFTGRIYQVTSSKTGAYHPAVGADSASLLFSEYTPHGFRIAKIPLSVDSFMPVNLQLPASRWKFPAYTPAADTGSPPTFQAKPYRKWGHLIRPHSWLPFYASWEYLGTSLEQLPVYPGFMLFSQNLLGTAISSIGYRYSSEGHALIPRFIFSGLYPVIEFEATSWLSYNQPGYWGEPIPSPEGTFFSNLSLRTYLPLLFSRHRFLTRLIPLIEYRNEYSPYQYKGQYYRGLDFLTFNLAFSHFSRMAMRDLYPRWGQFLWINYKQTPWSRATESVLTAEAALLFPGAARNHSLILRGGFEKQEAGSYFLSGSRLSLPRGYETEYSLSSNSLAITYALPLGYPDWTVSSFLYLKRIRMQVFYDRANLQEIFTRGYPGLVRDVLQSAGSDLLADFHAFRMVLPISAGIRMGYKPDEKKVFSAFLFSVSTNVF